MELTKQIVTLSAIVSLSIFSAPLYSTNSNTDNDIVSSSPKEYEDLGAIKLLTQKNVTSAARLVKHGKTISLALDTTPNTPAYPPRKYNIEITKTDAPLGTNKATFLDDKITTHNGIGTQIDGFGHAGKNFVHYNGVHVDEFFSTNGITKFSTSDIPPIVTRGILLNMADYLATDMVTEGTSYNKADILGALKKQKLTLKPGDVVIFHSGWNQLLGRDDTRWLASHPGLGIEGAHYLASKGVVAVGADSAALEVIPFEKASSIFPVHQVLLVEHGVYILEGLKTDELVANNVDKFMFVLGIPKLMGSVQSIINPVAIY